jgi:hypothetical protein
MEGTGPLNSLIVDMIGMWINFVDIFVKFITPVFITFLQTTITASATIPGVGTATAPIAATLELIEEPLQFFLMGLPTFFKMLFTIQRKEFKQALNDMVNIFPILGVAIVAATNYMTSLNKVLYILSSNLETIDMNSANWMNMSDINFNRVSSLDLEKIYDIFIKPNEGRIPFLKRGVNLFGLDDIMNKYKYNKSKIMDKYRNINIDSNNNIGDIMNRTNRLIGDISDNMISNTNKLIGDSSVNIMNNMNKLIDNKDIDKKDEKRGEMRGGNMDEFMTKFINVQNDIKNLI